MSKNKDEWSISYKQIGIILISFALGVIVALLLANSKGQAASSFTTTELIGFVLSVILSGASIVLAIAAIALGKSSEQAVINRSDESIRLQTEVFTKTTDALQGIKASTDVTEKRIEDIISGRAGDLSKQIAEIASDESVTGNLDVKELEEKIRKSIAQGFDKKEMTEEEKEARNKRRKEQVERRNKYEKYHDKILYELANKADVKIQKLGHGKPTRGEVFEEKFDAILIKGDEKIVVSTFMPIKNERYSSLSYGDILQSLASEVERNDIAKVMLIHFEDDGSEPGVKQLEDSLSIAKESISSKFTIESLDYSEVDSWVSSVTL
jgi:hypothetical protein